MRVYTAGTLFEPDLLPEGGATKAGLTVGRLLAIQEDETRAGGRMRRGFCTLDCASCELRYGVIDDDERASHLGA